MVASERARFYHPELDGLRFLAFLGVFILHCYPFTMPANPPGSPLAREIVAWICSFTNAGVAGVDLFFVLSAFLITELLLREHQRTGRLDVRAFYMRRALRIWPLYFVFLTLAVLIEPLLPVSQGESFGMSWPVAFSFYGFVGNWAVAFSGQRLNTIAIILWTVSIEEQFYLVWPLLMKWLQPKRLLAISLAMIAIATITRGVLVAWNADELMLKANTFARLDSIGAGALLALALRKWRCDFSPWTRWCLLGAGLFLFVATYRYLRLEPLFAGSEMLTYPLWAVAAVLVMLAVYRQGGSASVPRFSLLSCAPLTYLGRISYGLYVWHLACILLLAMFGLMGPGSFMIGLYALPLSIVVASISYELLEKPFLRWKQRWAVIASRQRLSQPLTEGMPFREMFAGVNLSR